MGANLDTRTYKINDREVIKKKFEEAVDADRFENGNSYSGGVGMLNSIAQWFDRKCATYEEAYSYIEEHHHKWDPAMAVSFYYSDEEYVSSSKVKAKALRIKELAEESSIVLFEAQKKFAADVAPFKTCKGCKSKLNMSAMKVKSMVCPICDKSLLNSLMMKKYDKLRAKISVLVDENNAQIAFEKGKIKKEVGWVVGGWCSS